MKKVVKAGDKIQEAITASWFNEINKSRNILPPQQRQFIPENPVHVDCIADTGVDLARFTAANIVGPAIPYEAIGDSALQYSSSMVKVNSTLVADKWGIVQGPCLPEHSSRLIVLGVTWAIFTYTSGHTHVDVVGGALVSGTSGKAIILSTPESSGKPGLILIRGATEYQSLFFELTSAMSPLAGPWLTARATANFKDSTGSTLFSTYLYSWLNIIDDAPSGYKGTAELIDGLWRFEQGPCVDYPE